MPAQYASPRRVRSAFTGRFGRVGRTLLALVTLAIVAGAATGGGEPVTPAGASLVVLAGVARSRGMTALVGWIVGGALIGGAVGYGASLVLNIPITTFGTAGLGVALGGGLGAVTHLLSTADADVEAVDDEQMTVDMRSDDEPGPRPADLFEEHPDPVLYVTDAGHGPVVRAANDAYGRVFNLPPSALSDTPLEEALVATESVDSLVDGVAAGEAVDQILRFETTAETDRYRVRSIGEAADGYLLFTPVS